MRDSRSFEEDEPYPSNPHEWYKRRQEEAKRRREAYDTDQERQRKYEAGWDPWTQ